MKTVIAAALLATACVLPAAAFAAQPRPGTAQTQPVRYNARQFLETTSYGMASSTGIAFSRDGRNLLIHSDRSGVFNVYALPIAGGDPVQISRSTTNATFAATYFPNDDRVIFTADQGGNELDHVYVRLADGSVRDLTPGQNLKADFVGWSADGRTFFVSSNEREARAFDIYAYDAATYERRMIFRNSGEFTPGEVSRDGRWVVLGKANSAADSDVYLYEVGNEAAPRLITPHQGNIAFGAYGFTPDSSAVVYGTNETSEYDQAWRYQIAGGQRALMLRADWDVMFVLHSNSGRYRVSAINEDGSTRLTITDTRNNRPVRLTGVPDGDLGGVRFNRDETMVAFTVASDTSPADIFVADLRTGRARRLTHALNPAIDERQLVTATVARFPSWDGTPIPGILYRPREASAAHPVPAVVYVHGGPGGQSRRGYSGTIQHLVNNGYAVFAINNRGSSGYGKTFFHMDDRRHGDVDLRDVVASRDWLAGQDWISDRVAIMGGSYGGYMTAAAMAFHPDTFDVGIDIFGVTNWVRTLQSIPAWWGAQRTALFDEMGDPATDAERHRRISPLFHAGQVRRPMLVIQGANDPRVLKVESDELVAAIRANNVPVEYIVFPDEGHGFLRKQNRIDASEAYLRFLNQHMGH
jgi:dipeptidyl aminopeptidase/acylaminoacyl peptidase